MNQIPYKMDIKIRRAATFVRKVKWVQKSNNQPFIDLNLFNVKMTVVIGSNRFNLTTGNGGIIVDPVLGEITINIGVEKIREMIKGVPGVITGVYDLLVHSKQGPDPSYVLLEGNVQISPGVTRVTG